MYTSLSKRFAIALLLAATLCFAGTFCAKADDDEATIRIYLHDSGYNDLSDADIARIHTYLKTHGNRHIGDIDPAIALNTPVSMPASNASVSVPTPSPSQPKTIARFSAAELAAAANRVTAVQLAFDAAKRPGNIRQVLKDAEYSLNEQEFKAIEKLIYDYGWYPVIGAFREAETILLQARNRGDDDETIKALFGAAYEIRTNNMEWIVQCFVLKKYGLFK